MSINVNKKVFTILIYFVKMRIITNLRKNNENK